MRKGTNTLQADLQASDRSHRNPVGPLQGRVSEGSLSVRDGGPRGMIALKGDPGAMGPTLTEVTGLGLPSRRRAVEGRGRALLWMAPDELLLLCDRTEAAGMARTLSPRRALVADVSDMRAAITLAGPGLRDALAKLTPADMRPDALPLGEVRRTRLGQIPAAIWFSAHDRATVLVFRSVATYAFDLLANAAATPVHHIRDT